MNIYELLNLCFAIKTISSHAFLIKIAKVVFFTCKLFSHLATIKLQSCFYKAKKRKLRNYIKCGIITATE